jgi:hypothetical protein
MHWKNIETLRCLLKYIYLPLKIHSYVLIYIHIPSNHITIPSKNLTYFWHVLQYHYYTPISFHILPYTLKLSWNLSIMHLFVLLLYYFSKLSWRPIILPKCCCTCHDMFIGIQKWSIFHESHKSYWLIKYSNPKLISRDIINTCWTYVCQSQKTSLT